MLLGTRILHATELPPPVPPPMAKAPPEDLDFSPMAAPDSTTPVDVDDTPPDVPGMDRTPDEEAAKTINPDDIQSWGPEFYRSTAAHTFLLHGAAHDSAGPTWSKTRPHGR